MEHDNSYKLLAEPDLPTGANVAAALFRLENSQEPADVQRGLRAVMARPEAASYQGSRSKESSGVLTICWYPSRTRQEFRQLQLGGNV